MISILAPAALLASSFLVPPGELVLELSERTHDFGDVWQGATLEHTFQLGVKGPGPTTIATAAPT